MIADLGDTVEVTAKTIKKLDKVQAGSRFVDGLYIDDTDSTIRDRVHLGGDGLIITVCCVSSENGLILQRPDLIFKGITLSDEQTEEIKDIIERKLSSYDLKAVGDHREIRKMLRSSVRHYVLKKTKNNPMIIPIITEN